MIARAHDSPAAGAVRERLSAARRLLDAVEGALPAALSDRTGAAVCRALDAAIADVAAATREAL